MHIGLDLDDTITRCPEFFTFLTRALIAAGHRVTIITYREFAAEDLADLNVVYNELVLPTPEEYYGDNPQGWQHNAARFKADACRRLGVDILFDDLPEIVNALAPRIVAFMPVDPARGQVGYTRPA